MSSYPDANAFMRGYLRNPTDVTARLVFADWLEETGEPWNLAWARYIRLKAEADRCPLRSGERTSLEREADAQALDIQARLTIPATLLVGYPKSLLQLLPPGNITVRIGDFRPTYQALHRVREDTARSIPVFPLDDSAGALIVAHPTPVDEHVITAVRNLLSPSTIVVGGSWDEIVGSLNAAYATAHEQNELLEQMVFDPPNEFEQVPGTYPVTNGSDFVDDVMAAGQRRQADLISFIPQAAVVVVFYRTPGGVAEAGRISRADWRYIVFPEIIRRGEATGGEFTVEVVRNGGEQAVRIWPQLVLN
ncbi:MAG TPA: TIGR02996 domain-containing protein [Gemmata sp.]|nr:TIGR02996 domain-containing protein [Gemmata sp.]